MNVYTPHSTRIVAVLLAMLCTFAAQAQKTRRADKLFARWEYYRAAKKYEKAAHKHPTQDLCYKTGESYRMMDKYREAMQWYDKVDAAGPYYSNPEFYIHYGQVLRSNDRCMQARRAFATYDSLVPADTLAAFYAKACDIVAEDHQWDEKISMRNVQSLNTASAEFGAVPYRNGLSFASSRKTEKHDYAVYGWTGDYYLDIFYSEYDSSKMAFKKPVLMGENNIDQIYHDGPASFSRDFDTIYISRSYHDLHGRKKKTLNVNRVKIYWAKHKGNSWERMKSFQYNNDSFSVAHPFITADGNRIYFSSDMPGGYGDADLYYCAREGESWGMPVNLGPTVNTAGKEAFPSIDSLGNLYFSSDGYAGFGGLDICVAIRDKKTGSLNPGKVLKYPFNTPMNDFGIRFIQNGRSGYISSNRGESGNDDIYSFDLSRDSVRPQLLSSFYVIGYRPYEDKDAVMNINVRFVDSKTMNPIDTGKFWRVDAASKRYDEVMFTHAATSFTVPEKSKTRLNVLCRFYDFFQDSISIPNLYEDSTITLVLALNRTPVKERVIVMRSDNATPVKGRNNQALFDFGKYDIRPDARRHLDSVVYYMQEYPDAVVDISAHTDSRGTAKYNLNLSEKRAQSALAYLRSKGIAQSRMRAKGYGFERLTNRCAKGVKCTESEHQQNRRVEFWIKAAF